MYRFTKATKEVSSSSSSAAGVRPGGGRLFMLGTREADDDVRDLQAVHTKRHLSTEVTGSNHESHKVDRRPDVGRHSVTTRVLRKTTMLTRGVEVSASESMMKTGHMQTITDQPYEESKRSRHHQILKTKKAKVVSGHAKRKLKQNDRIKPRRFTLCTYSDQREYRCWARSEIPK